MLYSLTVIKERSCGRLDNMDHLLSALFPAGEVTLVDFCNKYYEITNDIETIATIAAAVKIHRNELEPWLLVDLADVYFNAAEMWMQEQQDEIARINHALAVEARTLANASKDAYLQHRGIAESARLTAQAALLIRSIFGPKSPYVFNALIAAIE